MSETISNGIFVICLLILAWMQLQPSKPEPEPEVWTPQEEACADMVMATERGQNLQYGRKEARRMCRAFIKSEPDSFQ